MKKIKDILKKNNINDYVLYGDYQAKIPFISEFNKDSKLILVTATTPTKYGEGKTTVAIGLHDTMRKMGYKSMLSLREPSLGPTFGVKGGATGGGKALVLPEVNINLHFNGDFHAITSANNLICAQIDNEIFQGNELDIQRITFKRCLDICDRSLREITYEINGTVINNGFEITAASEIMAVLCLSKDYDDLKNRLENMIIGYNSKNEEIYLKDLNMVESVLALLSDAINPNVVQSNYGNPVIVHGGPFANIAHGCSTITSLNVASYLGDYVITEAGFAADMGGFKFLDIVARNNNIKPYAVVLITTIRSLKYMGQDSLVDGLENLRAHIENLLKLNTNLVVTLNKFDDDTKKDIKVVKDFVNSLGVKFATNSVYQDGEKGAKDLVKEIVSFEDTKEVNYLYSLDDKTIDKINAYLTNIMHANPLKVSDEQLELINSFDKYKYPICMVKTEKSISHDPKVFGYPKDYDVTLKDIKVSNGAKFIKVYLGGIITMPGLSKTPSLKEVKFDNGDIVLPR